jgi:hypothetical protein
MSSGSQLRPVEMPDPHAAQRALLERIASSPGFQKSNRARELLLYVGKRSLLEPGAPIHEQELGIELFGRPANYDTSQDTLVRVQASQLRKKLQVYFETEGAQEPWTVEMPKGSYALVFRPRASGVAAAPSGFWQRRGSWGWTAAILLGMLSLALGIQNQMLARRAGLGLGSQPYVDRFWSQAFSNGQRTYLVVADGTLMFLENQLKRQLTVQEYERHAVERMTEQITEPPIRALIQDIVNRQYTPIVDADLAHRFGLIGASNGIPLDVVLARNMALLQLTSANVILLGSRRANPWMTLYEDKLNFQIEFSETPRAARFVNRAPARGEPPVYQGRWGSLGYCRVAYLPNLKGVGNALLISGTDIQSTDAGGSLISREPWLERLRTALKLGRSDDLPYFEALLEGPVVGAGIPRFELIAVRRH